MNTRLPAGAALPIGHFPPSIWAALDRGESRTCDLTRGAVERLITCIDVPIGRKGRASYVLSVIMRPHWLQSVMDGQRLAQGQYATVLDRRGRIVWRNVDPDRFVGHLATSDMRTALARRHEGILYSISMEGVPTLAAFSTSPRTGWTFIVAIPRAQIGAGSLRALYGGLLGAAVLLGLAILAGVALARRIAGAVDHLCQAAVAFRDHGDARYVRTGLRDIDAVGSVLEEAIAARALSDERFDLAQEVGGIGAWDWDVPNDRGYVSDSYKRMHGLEAIAGPLSTAQVREVILPEDLAGYGERLIAARGRREPSVNEYRVRHPDGTLRWISAKGRPLFDADGRYVRAVGIVRDITAERESAEALLSSQTQLSLATEAAQIGIWDLDPASGRLVQSDRARILFDLPADGDRSIDEVLAAVHPDDRDALSDRIARALDPDLRESLPFEYRVVRRDGGVRWVLSHGAAVFANDRPRRFTGAVIDITERKLAEEELRRLNGLLESSVVERTAERDRLWALSRDPFVVADDRGVWLAASPAWTDLLGWTQQELVGRTAEWIEHPEDQAASRAEERRLATGHVVTGFVNRLRTLDGAYRWLSWTAVPNEGRFYSVARDITDERERTEALRKAEEALRQSQKMESIGQITGGLAHDFNNLLAPIVGTLDLLQQRGLADDRSRRLVDGALEAAERARLLVQRLLAFARRQPLQTSAIDVGALVDALRGLLTTTLGPRIELQTAADDAVGPAFVDANQLELAILNLAVNARDAMPDGGRLTIEVGALKVGEAEADLELKAGRYVALTISDNGIGMPQTVVDRAIEPFFSTKGTGRGTGLGLSMVHGLAAQLGGAMRIASRVGEGTTIQLLLPAAQSSAASTDLPQQALPVMKANRQTVLLVDDEPLVRGSTALMLAELGYAVIEAGSAEQALSILDGRPGVDLLVTDHLMPGMTGTELARETRRRWGHLPVLIISGYADVDDIAADLPRLAKPFRTMDLMRSLTTMAAPTSIDADG
ncbi:PAS domain S-box protein [Sphingomonas sp. MA1305]|nr:PAS domain S-box protein [Sphingomonas sp. MA1305]